MKNFSIISAIMFCCSLISGCVLTGTIDKHFGAKDQAQIETVLQDQIIGMNLTSNDKKNDLVLIGKKYDYVIKNASPILTQQLLKDFPPDDGKYTLNQELPLQFIHDQDYAFSTEEKVYFIYPINLEKIHELFKNKTDYLQNLFITSKLDTDLDCDSKHKDYICIKFKLDDKKHLSLKSDTQQISHRFKSDIPITIEKRYFITTHKTSDKIVYYTLSPIAVVLDIALFPIECMILDCGKGFH